MKKWAVLPLLIVLLVLTAGCPVRVVEPEPEEITTAFSPMKGGLKLELSLPRVTYQRGDELRATLSLLNTTPEPISFSTRTSQLFDLIIEGTERALRWSEDKMFLQVITPRHIPGNGALSEVLSLKIYLAPGDVYLTGVTVPFELNGERIQLRTTRLKIVVESDPSAVTPQPEEPAEKPERPAVAPEPGEPAEKPEPPVVTPKPPVVKPQPEEEIIIAFSGIMAGLKLQLSVLKGTYQPGEILEATLSLINTTPEEISFSTRTSQVFDLIIPGQGLPRRMLWSEDRVFLPVITEHYIPADERLSDILSLKIDLTSGEFELIGVTVPFELNGELIRLKTTPLRITVE